jgi:hypothetical protein
LAISFVYYRLLVVWHAASLVVVVYSWIVFLSFIFVFLFFVPRMCRYLLGLSKTIKLDIKHCNEESLRRPIDYYSEDVIETYNTELGNHAIEGINMYLSSWTEIGSVPKFRGIKFWPWWHR